jgi:hypothetical protein
MIHVSGRERPVNAHQHAATAAVVARRLTPAPAFSRAEARSAPPTSTSTRTASRALGLYFVAVVLSSQRVGGSSWLVAGDVALVAAIFVSLLRTPRLFEARLPSWAVPSAIGMLTLAAFSNLAQLVGDPLGQAEALKSISKLTLYVAGIILFSAELTQTSPARLCRTARFFLRVSVATAALQLTAHLAGFAVPLLPGIREIAFDHVGALPRAHGFFSEPSTLATFLVVMVALLWEMGNLRRSDIALVLIGVLLSGSLSGVALTAACGLLAAIRKGALRTIVTRGSLLISAFAGVGLLIPAIGETVQRRVLERVPNTISRADASGSGRLMDGWTAAIQVAEQNPWFGVGLGQQRFALADLAAAGRLNVDPRLVEQGNTWNVFANTYAELGTVGLLALVCVIGVASRSIYRFVFVVLVGFSTGVFLGWAWWFLIALMSTPVLFATARRSTSATTSAVAASLGHKSRDRRPRRAEAALLHRPR